VCACVRVYTLLSYSRESGFVSVRFSFLISLPRRLHMSDWWISTGFARRINGRPCVTAVTPMRPTRTKIRTRARAWLFNVVLSVQKRARDRNVVTWRGGAGTECSVAGTECLAARTAGTKNDKHDAVYGSRGSHVSFSYASNTRPRPSPWPGFGERTRSSFVIQKHPFSNKTVRCYTALTIIDKSPCT